MGDDLPEVLEEDLKEIGMSTIKARVFLRESKKVGTDKQKMLDSAEDAFEQLDDPEAGRGKLPVDIVFSYQSAQTEFLIQLREKLRERGFTTTDGTEVGTSGCSGDWRRYYFWMLERCQVFIPILSKEFLLSTACEEELTAAV